jgi:hypothetical protein
VEFFYTSAIIHINRIRLTPFPLASLRIRQDQRPPDSLSTSWRKGVVAIFAFVLTPGLHHLTKQNLRFLFPPLHSLMERGPGGEAFEKYAVHAIVYLYLSSQ